MAPVQTVPTAAFECSSQPPTSECCDDRLNPPKTRRLKRARPRSPRKSPARDDTLEPHGASVPEHRLAVVALKALREADRRAGFFQRLVQHPAPDQFDAAQVLRFEPDTIEGVQTGARLTVAAEEP